MITRCTDIFYTAGEINWREKGRKRGQGDLNKAVTTKSIVDELEGIVELLNESEYSCLDRMYQIRYIQRYNNAWVVDDNRKLFIGKELEKHLGINLETKDVTHVYDVSEEDQMNILQMITLHEDEKIYLPSFKPEIQYPSNEERFVGRQKISEFRKINLRKRERIGLTKWLSVETGWFLFPFYMIITVVILMIILVSHMILFDDIVNVETLKNMTEEQYAKSEL